MKCALVNGFYRYSLTAAEDCSILALLWELWQCSAHRFSLLLPQAVSFSTHFSFLVSTSSCSLSFVSFWILEVGVAAAAPLLVGRLRAPSLLAYL